MEQGASVCCYVGICTSFGVREYAVSGLRELPWTLECLILGGRFTKPNGRQDILVHCNASLQVRHSLCKT